MSTQVRYYSRSGHTKAVAEAIAKGAGCEAESVSFGLKEKTDVLFVGSGLYAAMLDKNLKDFLEKLDPAMVGKVVMFGTSAITKRAFRLMKKILEGRGVKVEEEYFYVKSAPNAGQLKEAEAFGTKFKA